MAALNNLVGRIRSATTRLANPGAAKAQKSFGVPLDPEATHVPLVLVKCIEVLRIKGPGLQGIFRIAGNYDEIERVIARLDSGENVDLDAIDPMIVSSIVKRWLRDLPEPLTTYEWYDPLLAAINIKDQETQLHQIKTVISYLPEGNRRVIMYIMEFLYGLLDHQKATLMGSSNLAIVFAPNLLRSKSGDIAVEIQDTPYCNGVCQYLIENYHAVFDSEVQKLKEKDAARAAAAPTLPTKPKSLVQSSSGPTIPSSGGAPAKAGGAKAPGSPKMPVSHRAAGVAVGGAPPKLPEKPALYKSPSSSGMNSSGSVSPATESSSPVISAKAASPTLNRPVNSSEGRPQPQPPALVGQNRGPQRNAVNFGPTGVPSSVTPREQPPVKRPPPNMARRSMQFSSTNPFADAAAPEYDAPLSTFPTPIQPGRAGISSSSDFVQQHRQNSPPPPQITNKPPSPAPTAEGGQRKWPTVTQNYMARTIDTGRGRSATVAAPSTQEPPPRPASNAPVYRGYNDKY